MKALKFTALFVTSCILTFGLRYLLGDSFGSAADSAIVAGYSGGFLMGYIINDI